MSGSTLSEKRDWAEIRAQKRKEKFAAEKELWQAKPPKIDFIHQPPSRRQHPVTCGGQRR
ncbi:MAG: hypothetical protein AAB511_03255 [Patescibacteria group bacterium]